jgi:sugar/nucleoside kinase (ribokinase family)
VLDLNARPHAWRDDSLDEAATKLIAQADLVKASQGDLGVLGIPDGRHLAQLLRSGASFVVTDGSKPVQLHSPQGGLSFEPPTLSARRSVGAGDAFDAGMIYRLLHAPWPQSLAAWREVLSQGYEEAAKHMTAASGPA